MFQSTPPAEARGDFALLSMMSFRETFQSTPPAEARGDITVVSHLPEARGFNPLPPPNRGETSLTATVTAAQ